VVAGVPLQPDGSVVVDGSVPIRDLNRAMDWHLPDERATTLRGLVIHEARSIPERGQSFTFHGFRFRVLRRERNRSPRCGSCRWRARPRSRRKSRNGRGLRFGLLILPWSASPGKREDLSLFPPAPAHESPARARNLRVPPKAPY